MDEGAQLFRAIDMSGPPLHLSFLLPPLLAQLCSSFGESSGSSGGRGRMGLVSIWLWGDWERGGRKDALV